MSEPRKRKDPGLRQLRSGKWQATWRGPDGTQHGRSFPTKREAREFRDQQLVDIRRGTFINPQGPLVLVSEWVELWLELRQVRPTTAAVTKVMLDRHILPRFGSTRLGAVTRRAVQAWVQDLERTGLARGTVWKAYTTFAQIMAAAVDEDLIAKSPCRGIRFDPKAPPARVPRALSVAEASRLLEALAPVAAAPRLEGGQVATASGTHDATSYTLVLTLLGTGMRWGEATGLRRRHVQLLRRPPYVEVAEALHEVDGKLYMGEPKTRASLRRIPLPAVVAQALATHLPTGGDPEDLVFTTPTGQPWRRPNFVARWWGPALERADLGKVRIHDLRHTTASWLADAGIPEVMVAAVLGHRVGPSVTAAYTQAIPGWERLVIDALDERLAALEGGIGVGG